MSLTNAEIAAILDQHGDLMEIAGENRFRVRAYRRAASAIRAHERPVADEPDLTAIDGVGEGIAAVIREILETGQFSEFEELQEALPGSLLTMLDIPGLGAKRVQRFYQELNITSVAELEEAAREGRLRALKGIGPKAEQQILEGIAFLRTRTDRYSIGLGLPLAERLRAGIAQLSGARVELAGSVRRMCETVGDINLLVVADNPEAVFGAVQQYPEVAGVISIDGNVGVFNLHPGPKLKLFVAPTSRAGSAWIRATGSEAHLSALGGYEALPDAETEEACYAALGMEWIPPELREDRGELDAAREGRLPRLIELADIKGDLHLHTTWSDGSGTILEMAEAAAALSYRYLAICDHSGGLGIANGLDAARLAEQRAEIERLRPDAPLHLLAGSEVEVHRDGRLDFEDDVLAQLDLVVASLHSGIRQDQETITARICRTLENPHVDIVAHPTGRLIERRQGASYDWDRVYETARRTATALEINADPARLDMREEHARGAFEAGCLIAIDSDAHHPESFANMRYGVAIARRAWVEPQQVINTWPLDDLLAWLTDRRLPQG
ncbi:MAG TPA: helix-hairpin-helix domain-containing protein [Thermomicrobiales bacterium]|nr:helix-hairpin-helix domain-containing protein [Thermomicrobiales bacterium]